MATYGVVGFIGGARKVMVQKRRAKTVEHLIRFAEKEAGKYDFKEGDEIVLVPGDGGFPVAVGKVDMVGDLQGFDWTRF